jgi:acetyl-CoA C-acetyltransferase
MHQQLPDNTPILVGAGQYTEHLNKQDAPSLHPPMELAARACSAAIADAGGALLATDIDAIAVIRLFSDSAPLWACPFGRSNNPPQSIAQRLGANPKKRIYSNVGGNSPLQLLAELSGAIARGDIDCALVAGAEAIASQRHAQRSGKELDWAENYDHPLDSREYTERFAAPAELASGMYLPAHYYALIENLRAHQQGNDEQSHRQQMARLLTPLSEVAGDNPFAYFYQDHKAEDLISDANGNYALCVPYNKLMVAQDAVNQAAAIVLISAGKARELGIDPDKWVLQLGYAEGNDNCLFERSDPGTSQAMQAVMSTALQRANCSQQDMDLLDIYSCFPCAVEAVRDALGITADDPRPLTVTGGLPFFGGPGNNYSMHALAEMVTKLRNTTKQGLVTANGGQLSKHAAVVLSANVQERAISVLDYSELDVAAIDTSTIETVPECSAPVAGTILTYTIIFERKRDDMVVVLAHDTKGARFFASSVDQVTVTQAKDHSPIGKDIEVWAEEDKYKFKFRV